MVSALVATREVHPEEVAELILHLAETSHREWPIERIFRSLNEVLENLNWRRVYECLANERLHIWNVEYLYTIVDCWVSVSGIITVPYEIFFRPWKNRAAQVEFMRVLLESDTRRTQVYANIFFEKLVSKEELRHTRYRRTMEYESNMNCAELFISIREIEGRELVELIGSRSPEYCLIGLAGVRPFCEDLFDRHFVSFCELNASNFVHEILFRRDAIGMFHTFQRVRPQLPLTRILDVLVEHKMLTQLVEWMEPEELAFDVIVLAARREHLNLKIWLSTVMGERMKHFVKYLTGKMKQPDTFPLTRQIAGLAATLLEERASEELRELRSILGESQPQPLDQAVGFISEIINSHAEIQDSIYRVRELLSGDETSSAFAKRIFGVLVDNYANLFRLPNSDLLAEFLGELVKQGVLIKPYMRMMLQLVKNSLVNPACEREFAFAFRGLEIFLGSVPEFFTEIEESESVRSGLIRKELILVDEQTQQPILLDAALEHVLGPFDYDESEMASYVAASSYDIANASRACARSAVAAKLAALSLPSRNSIRTDVSFPALCAFLFRSFTTDPALWAAFVRAQPEPFQTYVVDAGFELVRSCFVFRLEDELLFFGALGLLLGQVVLAQDRAVPLDQLDFRTFIMKSIEYRRISLCVAFTTSFFAQGTSGLTCVPHNPWLMQVLDLLAGLFPCTLAPVRSRISQLFSHFGLEMVRRPPVHRQKHLIKYVLRHDGVVRQVLAAALDFSVREVCNKIVKEAIAVARSTAVRLFANSDDGSFFYFRNLLINLTRALIHVSAQEPLKASICGNVTHFMKLSGNELELDEVYGVALENLTLCCGLIENVGITSVTEQAQTIYSGCERDQTHHQSSGTSHGQTQDQLFAYAQLPITATSSFTPKTHIRSIENAEYQEIRSWLIQLARKSPLRKQPDPLPDWHMLLGPGGPARFEQLWAELDSASDRDSRCLSLCKYLVGHAIRTDCADERLFLYVARILALSPRTSQEVVGWLIYSGDHKRYNIPLVRKFIQYGLVRLDEYDQALVKLLSSEEGLSFVLDLLNELVLGPLPLCTVYDFIHTIETLNLISDDSRVFDFFRAVEAGMIRIGESRTNQGESLFDAFVNSARIDSAPSGMARLFSRFCSRHGGSRSSDSRAGDARVGVSDTIRSCFPDALRSSWHHFVLHSGAFRFYKVDILAYIAADAFHSPLREALQLLVQAHEKRNYAFFSFFHRFFYSGLTTLEDSVENRSLVLRALEVLIPVRLPAFTAQFVSLLEHPFVLRFLGKPEAFSLPRSLLEILKYSRTAEPLVRRFFATHPVGLRQYLLFLTPHAAPALKNLFSAEYGSESKPSALSTTPGTHHGSAPNTFFALLAALSRNQRTTAPFPLLVDCLGENSPASVRAAEALRLLIDKRQNVREIALLVLIRRMAPSPPAALVGFYDEITVRKDVKGFVSEYVAKYYNNKV